jgi:hypothetical protein
MDSKEAICGLKVISVMESLRYWSVLKMNCIDEMHQVHGIYKTLINLWSITETKTFRFHIEKKRWEQLDSRFRSLITDYKHMKAMEALEFIIYSVPILSKYMNHIYLEHHKLLVHSLTPLFHEEISVQQLNIVEKKLIHYVLDFQVSCIFHCYIS